ncbi:uncharacterized protein F5147DRAFT_779226 [Suillus discolor]|uniref:GCN1-like HEAT repeats domain-containing protein n=1 Tax=Suillus discolor TaxID=1912936 RepID=A0A9P7EXG8_9AGAM|nr:uncharacterized protein F5147DRAFT_779226 [Suillus discolor]KAG2093711.1 hypothetical protein F5147DRAFT_779226 [Suillus discolor]
MSLRQKLAARGFCYQLMARPLFLLANQEEDGRYSNTLPTPLISPTARLIRLLWPDLHPGDYRHEEFRSPSMVYSPTSLALPPPPLDSRTLMWTRSQLFSDLVHANISTSRICNCFCMGPNVFCQHPQLRLAMKQLKTPEHARAVLHKAPMALSDAISNLDEISARDLAKCCSARLDSFHKWVGVATLRGLRITSVPEELQAEQFSSLVLRVLYRLRSLSEQILFDAATFSYAFPLLGQVLLRGGVDAGQDDGDEALEQVTLVLDVKS